MGFWKYDIRPYSPLQLIAVPAVILVLALLSVTMTYMATGMPVTPGIDFSGGIGVTIATTDTPEEIENYFEGYPLDTVQGISTGEGIKYMYLKFSSVDDTTFLELTKKINERYPDAKIDQIGESFGQTLQQQAMLALVLSFIGMAIVVFFVFRNFVPSLAVVVSAFADIMMAAAAMNVVGIPLSLGTTAALLMLIGYSVDSDILLTTRVLKRKGQFDEKMQGAFKTGLIMTSTTLCAILAMWVVSFVGQIQIIWEIASVLLIGLVFDLMNTWLTNAGILKWYVTKGKGRFSTHKIEGA